MEPEETKPTDETKDDDTKEEKKETKPKKQMSARARAEARRRRILESSAKRMNVVSGEVPSTPTTTDVPSPEVVEDVVQTDEVNNEEKAATVEVEDEASKKSTTTEVSRSASSSRLAQMRRRRFKKEQKKEEIETTAEETTKDDVVTKEDQNQSKAQPVTNETKPEPVVETETSEVQTGEEKKYLGVARMRRKRLAEKKKKEESEASTSSATANIVRHKSQPTEKVNTLPIYLHLFITLILFSVGVQIGLNQHSHIVWEDGMVVNELSVKESMIFSYLPSKKEENVIQSFSVDISPDVGMEDEFSTDEFSDFNAEVEENIDPIFRVDLDKFTEGPSFFNKIARIAIRCHRAIIAMIMFVPQTLLSIPHAIVTTKCYPYFFLISAFLRQGSALLGATIPSKTEEDDESNKKDILSMMIAGAKEMIGRTVPGFSVLKFFYNMLQEGRDDMMVVSCGLLFGLVVPLMKVNKIGDYEDAGVISDEL